MTDPNIAQGIVQAVIVVLQVTELIAQIPVTMTKSFARELIMDLPQS